jgi:hypothetical protein
LAKAEALMKKHVALKEAEKAMAIATAEKARAEKAWIDARRSTKDSAKVRRTLLTLLLQLPESIFEYLFSSLAFPHFLLHTPP